MKHVLRPRVIVPAVLSIALIAALVAFANLRVVMALIVRFPPMYLLWFFALMALYEAIRGLQWHGLLTALRVRAPLRAQAFAFVLSEFSRNLPVGSYFQNYVLQQSAGADFGRTSAATTVILVSEAALCLGGAMILGLGAWTAWLRPILGGVLVALLLLAWAVPRWHRSTRLSRWMGSNRHLRRLVEEVRRLREGAADLSHPRILIVQALLGAGYLLIASAGLYLILRGLDPRGTIDVSQAVAVYLFTLASAMIIPIPEASGVAALVVLGTDRNVAVAAMLLNRALSVLAALILAGAVAALLPDELRAVLQARGQTPRRGGVGPREPREAPP